MATPWTIITGKCGPLLEFMAQRLTHITCSLQLQINGYNSDLYRNSSEASKKPNGLVAIALLIQVRRGNDLHAAV